MRVTDVVNIMRIDNPFSGQSVATGSTSRRPSDTPRSSTNSSSSISDASMDSVSFSPAAQLSQLLGVEFRFPSVGTEEVRLTDIRASYQRTLATFEERFTDALRRAGIAQDPPITVTTDPQGRIRVQGENANKDVVEEILRDDEKLSNDVRYLSAIGSFLRAADANQEFIERWDDNPIAAIEEFFPEFSLPVDSPFALRISSDGIEDNVGRSH